MQSVNCAQARRLNMLVNGPAEPVAAQWVGEKANG